VEVSTGCLMCKLTQVVQLASIVLFLLHAQVMGTAAAAAAVGAEQAGTSAPGAHDAPQQQACCDGHSCCPGGCLGRASSCDCSGCSRQRPQTARPSCEEVVQNKDPFY
jgi:hypothetical protein